MSEISVTIVGNLVHEPERRTTKTGVAVTTLKVACSGRRFDQLSGRVVDGDVSYYQVTCWRQLADHVAVSLRRGQPVVVHGVLRQRRHERQDGVKVTYTDIEATSVGHDLARGVSTFQRTARRLDSQGDSAEAGAGSAADGSGGVPTAA